MGAWGPGSFENDTALDYAGSIAAPEDLLRPLTVRTPDQPVDADQACEIVVVAECVAAMRGHPHEDMPDDLYETVKGFGRPSKSLYHHARDHLAAVMARSELMELWAEDDPAPWNRAMHELIERLNLPAGKPPRRERKPNYNPSPCAFCDQPMGEDAFSMFDIRVDMGAGEPLGMGGFAHLACLNAALHPKHTIRRWITSEEDMPADLVRLLDELPRIDDAEEDREPGADD